MLFCPNCGGQVAPGSRFCAQCGVALSPTGSYPTVPSQPTRHGASPHKTPALLTGDWRGALAAAAAGVGTMAGLAVAGLVVLTSGSASYNTGSALLGDTLRLVAVAVGAELRTGAGFLGGPTASMAFRPLTITLVGYCVLAAVFLRRLRRSGPVTGPVLGLQAVRVAAVHAALLLAVALVSTVGSDDQPTVLGGEVDVASALFFGTVTLAIALGVAALIGLPGVIPGRVEHYRQLLAGPMRAVLFLVVVASAVTLAAVAWLLFADRGSSTTGDILKALAAMVLLSLPNAAGFALLFGMGVPLRAGVTLSVVPGDAGGTTTILDVTGQDYRYWLWPALAVALLLWTGVLSARWSPPAASGRPVGWWLAAVLPVALAVVSVSTTVSASLNGGVSGFGSFGFDANVGFDLLFVLLLGAGYGLVAGMLGAAMVRRRSEPLPTQTGRMARMPGA